MEKLVQELSIKVDTSQLDTLINKLEIANKKAKKLGKSLSKVIKEL